jgi:YVTN family beta-propeller protein
VTPITIAKGGSVCVDVHDDGVWVSNENDGSVTKLDPATNAVVGTVKVGRAPADGVRGPDGLEWIPNQGDGTVSLLDPATNTVVQTLHVGGLPFVVRTGFGSMWVDDFTGHTLARYRPAS